MVHLICYHFWSIGCYLFIKVSKCYHFRVLSFMLSFGFVIYFMLSFNVTIFWYYHLMLSFGVIIWCYHLYYHLKLSFFVIISPLFSFSWKGDTLQRNPAGRRWFDRKNYSIIDLSNILKRIWRKRLAETVFEDRHCVWDPIPELTINQLRSHPSTFTEKERGQPHAWADLNPTL